MASSDFPQTIEDKALAAAEEAASPTDQTPEEVTAEESLAQRLESLGMRLAKKRDDWIRERRSQGIDKRWQQDIDQYHMRDEANRSSSQMMEAAEQGFPVTKSHARPTRSTVFIGLTRQKSNAGEARFSDIILPTDDRNWGIKPLPVPELTRMAKSMAPAIHSDTQQPAVDANGQQLSESDIAAIIMKIARHYSDGMQTEIESQLTECGYNGELRKLVHYAAMMGTGILKGPIVENKFRRSWRKGTDATGKPFYELDFVKEQRPTSCAVDPRNVLVDPACGDDHQKGEGIFERFIANGQSIRDLAKQPGYMLSQLRKVLEEGPKRSMTMEKPVDGPDKDIDTSYLTKTYELWDYWGTVNYDDAIAAGIDSDLLPDFDPEDPLSSVSVCVILINDRIVKAFLNPVDTGDLPYDFFNWEKVVGSVWGYGIPYLMRAQQKVINSAWRQLMDNMGITAGPQIIVKQQGLVPADGEWTLTSRKIWYNQTNDTPSAEMMHAIEFESHAEEIKGVIEFAMKLVDEETALPAIAQGQEGQAGEPLGAAQMRMNSANVVLRRLVKQFDDDITRPHIGRYYNYNMLYSENDDIKGDFVVDARGSSTMVVRDIQNKAILGLMGAAANPAFAPYLDMKHLFIMALKAQQIDPEDIMADDATIQKNLQAQAQAAQKQDPSIQIAQLRAQAEGQHGDKQIQIAQIAAQAKTEVAKIDNAAAIEKLQAQKEVDIAALSVKQGISVAQIKKALATTVIQTNTTKEIAASKHHLEMQSNLSDNAQSAAPSTPGPFEGAK